MRKTKYILFWFAIIQLISCRKSENADVQVENQPSQFIAAVDISSYPEISQSNPIFYDVDGVESGFLDILKKNGINTVRLRVWVDPNNDHSGFEEVRDFAKDLRSKGFNLWLSVHYSDTWADPSQQMTPLRWQGMSFSNLKDSVYRYTKRITIELQPDLIQIGNEINSGLLHPQGHFVNAQENCLDLLDTAITAVRRASTKTRIMLHFAGLEASEWFYHQMTAMDYDIIGLSYYPIWHGKDLDSLKTTLQKLRDDHGKEVMIAETAYPFTLEWNDLTHNIVGLQEQLILPEYPATKEGQRLFVGKMMDLVKDTEGGMGICYWGAELISWKGKNSTEGSPWENQALFDFNNKALPALQEFNE